MAENKQEATTTAPPDDVGVGPLQQAKPTSEQSAREVKESLVHEPDKAIHPSGEPAKEADKTSYPVPNDAELNDPPVRSARPDIPIVRTLATGAGAHVPPNPDEFTWDGRPKDAGSSS